MAARLNPKQDERCRAAIQTTQLLKRLDCYVFGKTDDAGNKVEITAQQMKAIEILLKKSIPDLKAIEISGNEDKPLKMVFEWGSVNA